MLSYHGPLTMFDDQGCFDAIFSEPVEMYKFSAQSSNAVSIFEHDRHNEDFEKIYEEILFNIFLDEYRLQYIGEDTPELRQEILTSTTTALAGIKVQFVNSHTNETITLSPEDVYKKMTEYIVFLPDNAQSWMLSLGDTFFHALTVEMQSDMLQNKFVMPLASRGLTKSEQLGVLSDVRTAATRSHERSFLVHKTIAKQVEASLTRSNLGVTSSYNIRQLITKHLKATSALQVI